MSSGKEEVSSGKEEASSGKEEAEESELPYEDRPILPKRPVQDSILEESSVGSPQTDPSNPSVSSTSQSSVQRPWRIQVMYNLSPEMAEFCGADCLPGTEVENEFWYYICDYELPRFTVEYGGGVDDVHWFLADETIAKVIGIGWHRFKDLDSYVDEHVSPVPGYSSIILAKEAKLRKMRKEAVTFMFPPRSRPSNLVDLPSIESEIPRAFLIMKLKWDDLDFYQSPGLFRLDQNILQLKLECARYQVLQMVNLLRQDEPSLIFNGPGNIRKDANACVPHSVIKNYKWLLCNMDLLSLSGCLDVATAIYEAHIAWLLNAIRYEENTTIESARKSNEQLQIYEDALILFRSATNFPAGIVLSLMQLTSWRKSQCAEDNACLLLLAVVLQTQYVYGQPIVGTIYALREYTLLDSPGRPNSSNGPSSSQGSGDQKNSKEEQSSSSSNQDGGSPEVKNEGGEDGAGGKDGAASKDGAGGKDT